MAGTRHYRFFLSASSSKFHPFLAPISRKISEIADWGAPTHTSGVTGVDLELFNYDGLGRLTETSSRVGSDLERSLFSYDTLSRVVATSQLSQGVGSPPHLSLGQAHGYDASHNRIATTRHSGFGIARSLDSHDRLVSVNDGTGTAPDWAGYDYAGMGAVAERQVSGFVGQMTVDGVGRPTRRIYAGIHDEVLGWSSRNLLESHQRLDLAGATQTHTYDDAGRLLASQWEDGAGASLEWSPLGGETSFGFSYDAAENLVQGTRGNACGSQQAAFTIGDRNRPTAVDGKVIEWDANGNLTRKGNRLYSYDYRGRLVKVEEEPSAGSPVEVVRYTYDASNRRVGRQVPGSDAVQTVWDGWRPVEEYRVGSDGSTQLIARRTYGAGLDEIVLLEAETQTGWSSAIPFYDVTGNLVQLVAADGSVVERYEYTPYGDRRVLGTASAPDVAQLRWESNQLVMEVSERIDPGALSAAINEGRLTLVNDSQGGVTVPIEAGTVTTTCLATGRVFALAMIEPAGGAPDPRPAAGDTVTLSVPADAVQDLFGTPSSVPYSLTTVWPSGDMVLDDQAAPRLVEATVSADGFLQVELSEIVDSSTLTAITLGGQSLTWTALDDGRRFQSDTAVGSGSQTLALSTALLDLAGTPLASLVSETFERNVGSAQVVTTSSPQWGDASLQGNPFGFKGLEWDADAELYYVRNRYYDPELGRFITPDPLGYVDGPSMYQFGLNDPVNGSDPLGLYAGSGEERRQVREWLAAEEARLQQHRNQQKHRHEMVYLATTNPNHDPREVMFRYFQARGYTTVGAAEAVGGLLGPRGMSDRTAEGQFYDALAYQLANKGQIFDATLELSMAVGSVFGAVSTRAGLADEVIDVARHRLGNRVLVNVSRNRATRDLSAHHRQLGGDGQVPVRRAQGRTILMEANDPFAVKSANSSARLGFYDVTAHGNPSSIRFDVHPSRPVVNHRVLASYLRRMSNYQGEPIRLLSCSTGRSCTGFAKNLSNKLGVDVLAPDDILWVDSFGRLKIGPGQEVGGRLVPKPPFIGKWVRFSTSHARP